MERVKQHFNPKPSPIVRRFEFNTRCQKEGESVSEFVTALRKIAEHCEFRDVLDDMMRDRIICGISSKRTQQRLLQEADLTYAKAHDMALAAETAQKNSECLQEPTLQDNSLPSGEGGSVITVYSIPRKISQGLGGARDSHDRAKVATALGVEASTSLHSAGIKTMNVTIARRRDTLQLCAGRNWNPRMKQNMSKPIVLTRRMTMRKPIQCTISAVSQPNQ